MLLFVALLQLVSPVFGAGGVYSYVESLETGWNGVCASGKKQSPIDLNGSTVPREDDLAISWQTEDFTTEGGLNMNIAAPNDSGSTFTPPGQDKVFKMLGVHLHTWSEHTRDGVSYPVELHFVHQADDGSLAVIGLFLELGVSSPPIGDILDAANGATDDNPATLSSFNPLDLLANIPLEKFWTYDGSLTTPPCSEGVLWHVIETPGQLSEEQFEALLNLRPKTTANNRNTQPLNGRRVNNGKSYAYPENELNGWSNVCMTGFEQSPVDLWGQTTPREDGPLKIQYGEAKFKPKGGLSLKFSDKDPSKSTFTPPGQEKAYKLLQMHIHTLSEHTWEGQTYPMEIHFVHQSDDGEFAVIGLFYTLGESSPAWDLMIAAVENYEQGFADVEIPLNPKELFEDVDLSRYWTYDGSFTTPPCTEGVHWHVVQEPVHISASQHKKIRALRGGGVVYNFNHRTAQPLNGRYVESGGDGFYIPGAPTPSPTKTDDSSDDGEAPLWAIILIVVLALVLLVCVAYGQFSQNIGPGEAKGPGTREMDENRMLIKQQSEEPRSVTLSQVN